jgi:hypothetical protein
VIAYISRKLRKHEENYTTHNLELLAILYAMRVWRHYLIGHKLELKIDHRGLQHIFTQSDLNVRERHWSELLNEYLHKRKNEQRGRCIESENMPIFSDTSSDKYSWKDSNYTVRRRLV